MKNYILLFFVVFLFVNFAEGKPPAENRKQTSEEKPKKKKKRKKKKTKPAPNEYAANELIIDLRNPTYVDGILTTSEGGVIQGSDIRIQAKTIQYIKKNINGKFVHVVEADKDLMVQYKGRTYVGQELEYDLINRTGIIYNGKTFVAPWYLGGDKIELGSDGSYKVENVFITTCENSDSSWDIHAGSVNVKKKRMLQAKKVRFRLFKFPTMWLPSFRINLNKFNASPMIKYKVNWDKSSGPRASMRYRLYSWEEFALFGRLDYRLKRGFGGAIETEYYPKNQNTLFETKNYLATDVIPNNLKVKRRYRIQGVYHSISPTEKTSIDMVWDKYSDIYMPSDFKSDDFELNTAKRTEFSLRHKENNFITILYAHPRVNGFDSLKQDIPTAYLHFRPQIIPKTGIISYNFVKASYMSVKYDNSLKSYLDEIDSARFQYTPYLTRPVNIAFLHFVPYVGGNVIIYNHNPKSHNTITQAVFLYGAEINTSLKKKYLLSTHTIEPYIKYEGITAPSQKVNSYYVFSIQDGINRLNLLKLGVRNLLFSNKKQKNFASFDSDLFTNYFIEPTKVTNLAKIYLDSLLTLPSACLSNLICYNVYYHTLDQFNLRLGWTVNINVAFAIEYRHRSKYDLRKSNHENFIIDSSRSEEALLASPLSDKRDAILTHAFLRLNPYWALHFQSHHGWGRVSEPFYNEYKIDLSTMISTSWKVNVSFQHTQKDDRFGGMIYLIK